MWNFPGHVLDAAEVKKSVKSLVGAGTGETAWICPNGWGAPTAGMVQQSVGRWGFFPQAKCTPFEPLPGSSRALTALDSWCHLVFQNSWSSGLASSEDIAVLRCFACFHIILRGDQTRTPPKQAVDDCLACSNLLFSIRWSPGTVLLLEPPLVVANWFLSGWKKKQQQNNKWTAFGAPKGVENPRIGILLNDDNSARKFCVKSLCVKILTFLPSDFLWICKAMIRIDAMTLLTWLDSIDWDSLALGSAKGFVPLVKILMLWITCHVFYLWNEQSS